MDILAQARQLADFIAARWALPARTVSSVAPITENIAALLVDTVLQAGLNYRWVVLPRVQAVALAFPKVLTVPGFEAVIETSKFARALRWEDPEKPRRLRQLVATLRAHDVECVWTLRSWIQQPVNRATLMGVRGIGPKTVDYLSRLLGIQTVAVDRHALRLLRVAGLKSRTYAEAKRIIEFAADLLQVSRCAFDRLMWSTLAGVR